MSADEPTPDVPEQVRRIGYDLCHHCGKPPESDGDHACPCPHPDATCPDHPAP